MCTAERISDVNKETETVERKGMILGSDGSILIIGSAAGVALVGSCVSLPGRQNNKG